MANAERRDHIPNRNEDGVVWEGRSGYLDATVVQQYRDKFKILPLPICDEVSFINMIMVGETGAGKSSTLNTFATAISDKDAIIQDYRVAHHITELDGEKSITETLHLKPIVCEGRRLPINFFDCPGIDNRSDVQVKEIEMVIDGKVKTDVKIEKTEKMKQVSENVRSVPRFDQQTHCLIYVVKATSNPYPQDPKAPLNMIKEIRNNRKDDLPQFVIVTGIDLISNNDMENALKCPIIKECCLKFSKALNISMMSIFPVSNYVEEAMPNAAKNALSLMAMWHIIKEGEDYIRESTKPVIYKRNYAEPKK